MIRKFFIASVLVCAATSYANAGLTLERMRFFTATDIWIYNEVKSCLKEANVPFNDYGPSAPNFEHSIGVAWAGDNALTGKERMGANVCLGPEEWAVPGEDLSK